MKNHEFYDEHHEGDSHEKYDDYKKGHKVKHGGALKYAHEDKDYSGDHKTKKGRHHEGHHLVQGLHHINDHGSKKHYGDKRKYHNHDGTSEDAKWKYEKAKKSEDENEYEDE